MLCRFSSDNEKTPGARYSALPGVFPFRCPAAFSRFRARSGSFPALALISSYLSFFCLVGYRVRNSFALSFRLCCASFALRVQRRFFARFSLLPCARFPARPCRSFFRYYRGAPLYPCFFAAFRVLFRLFGSVSPCLCPFCVLILKPVFYEMLFVYPFVPNFDEFE